MNKSLFLFSCLLLALVIINTGCDTEPVTLATSDDGVKINFSNQGEGEPAILLVHGWTNNNTIWDLQIPVLAEKYQVIAVDLAGHGKSGNEREKWTMSAFGQDIAAVVEAAKLKDVILVGFSMGGPAILEAAKLIPDQLSGLILVETIKNPEAQIPPHIAHYVDSVYMDLIQHPSIEKLMQLGFFIHNPEASMEKVKSMVSRDQTGWNECLTENLRWSNEDCVESLKSLSVPLISINADYAPTAEEIFKKYVDSYDAKYISGSGHVVMWDATEKLNELMLESIAEIILEIYPYSQTAK